MAVGIDDLIILSLVGAGLGAASSAGGLFTSAATNYRYNKKLQDDAQQHQIYMYQNQNQWRVNDLRAAGLNPILSTHAGSSMPSGGSSSMTSSFGPNSSLDLVDAVMKSEGFANSQEQRKYNKAMHDVKLAQEEASLANSELDAEYKRALIHDLGTNTALKALDLDYYSTPQYQDLRKYRDIRDVTKFNSKFGQIAEDFLSGPLLRGAFSYDMFNSSPNSAYKVYKKPSKSNYTKYQYKTR